MITFESLTIIILSSNEKKSLRTTLQLLAELCDPKDIEEIIIFLKDEYCPAKYEAEQIVKEGWMPIPTRIHVQTIPGPEEILFEAPNLVHSTHFITIGSDLEMDLHSVTELINVSKKNPESIVCASKWIEKSIRENGRFMHNLCVLVVNFILNKITNSNATELLSVYQIYPKKIYQEMNFANGKEAFYGYSIKPLIYGVSYIEIPTNYRRRSEEKSNYNSLWYINVSICFIMSAIKLKHKKKKDSSV
ncbi:MAG: hypothetical protein IJS17_05455 [Clostridia bacterium]|nr:hypothetical protein [Clostridia bacterium]